MQVLLLIVVIGLCCNAENIPCVLPIFKRGPGFCHLQCQAVCINSNPMTFITAATCLFDDWGNFMGSPHTYYIRFGYVKANVTKMYIHPRFWFTSTQNNIAILFTTNYSKEHKAIACPVPKEDIEPINCNIVMFNPQNIKRTSKTIEVLDKEQYCVRQFYPFSMRLRHDNVCASIPELGGAEEVHRRYAGAGILCKNKQLFALLSYNYRCQNMKRTAVFTKTSSHLKFIENPKAFIDKEVKKTIAKYTGNATHRYLSSFALITYSLLILSVIMYVY